MTTANLAPISEKEFLEKRQPGASARVRILDLTRKWMVYEGQRDGKESFVEQGDDDEVRFHRSGLRYLQFGPMSPGDILGVIQFDHLHTSSGSYNPGTPEHDKAMEMLINARLWKESGGST